MGWVNPIAKQAQDMGMTPIEPADKPLPKGFVTDQLNPTYEQFSATVIPGMEAAPETVSGMELRGEVDRPTSAQTWGAAFRMENVIGSVLAREQYDHGEYDPDFDPLSPENIEGYEDYVDRFVEMRSAEQLEAKKRQIEREIEDKQILARSGWSGIGAQVVAGTVDPTIFIPVGGTVKKGESLLTIGYKSAIGAAGGAAISEGILQGTQETRTSTESGLNIAGASVLGGILGPSITAGYRGLTGKPVMGFNPDELDALGAKFDAEMKYDPDGDPQFDAARADVEAMRNPQSVGAAKVDEVTLEDYALAPSLGTAEVSSALRLNPLLRLATSESAKAREAGALLMENGMYLNRNKEGLASPVSVEQAMTEYRGWHADAQRQSNDAYTAHAKDKTTPRLSKTDFYREIGKAMRRGDKHADPNVQKAAQGYRQAVERTKTKAIEAGLLPPDVDVKTADSYFHRMWNRNVLMRKPQDFKNMVRVWAGESFDKMKARAANLEMDVARTGAKLSDDDAKFLKEVEELLDIERVEGGLDGYADDVTEHLYDTLMGHDSRTMPHGITAGPRGPLKERTFNIPDLYEVDGVKVEDFLVDDAQEVMDRYMRVMAADIELTRTFGDIDMTDTVRSIRDEYKDLIAQAKTEKERAKLNSKMEARIADIEGVRDVIRGNYGTPTYENMWRRGAAAVRTWNYTTMLGGMTVSALPDVGNKVLANGFLGLTRDLLGPMLTNLKGVKMAAREARSLGIAVEQTLATRIATLADIGDVYGRSSAFERGLAGMANHFSKWTGMRLWNDVMKQADYITASNRAIRAMSRPDRAGKEVKTWLANLGIGEAEYKRIMAQVKKHGETTRGQKLANADKWDDAEARRLWIGAMGKNANIQTVTPGAGDKLLVMNGDLGQTIGQFKSFVMGANQRVTIRGAQQARMGQARVASSVMTFMALGGLVYFLKMKGSGRDVSDDPVTFAREAVDRSGMISIFMEAFNTAEKVSGLTFVGDSPASRYASRNAAASMMGPSLGRAQSAFDVISNTLDGSLQDKDIHAIRKLLPYNNIFYMRQLLDDFEMMAVDATGAEETAISDRRERTLIPE